MEVLSPTHPPGPAGDRFSGFSPPTSFQHGFDWTSRTATSQLPEIVEENGLRIHVAVGRSVDKSVALLQWTFRQFGSAEICILHVHQPSPRIPTLLGKLPASQASSEVLSAYRREEKEQMRKLLFNYWNICYQSKVKACAIITEASQVQKGIVDLVNEHGIRKLVMGATLENFPEHGKITLSEEGPNFSVMPYGETSNMLNLEETEGKAKKSGKASYAAKNAPQFCEIWFVNKGKHAWTREAFEDPSSVGSISQQETAIPDNLRSKSLQYLKSEVISHPEYLQLSSARNILCAGIKNWDQAEAIPSTSSSSGYISSAEPRVSSDSAPKVDEENLHDLLKEITIEAEVSSEEVIREFLKCKNLEAEAVEAINKVKALESAREHEIKIKKEAEDSLKLTIHEREKLLDEREEIIRELNKALRNIALLESRVQEANRRREEATGELKLILASITALQHEKQEIRQQKMEAKRWLDRWKSRGQAGCGSYNGLIIGLSEDSSELAEFSLADLQTATCGFSESFKIGQNGYGSEYKGEILDRTVAIKKLHPHSMQRQPEFQQEVQILGKLRHPHLVNLIGICPEAWCLVYEYMPNGSLQDRLFRRSNICSLTWMIRARIIAEISSALLFLHSCKHEKIVHGDLKPENILLDSDLSCKLCDFGLCRLMPEEMHRCPSFRRDTEFKGAFSYTDPEFHKTRSLTPKSDIYSFGLIILQLLTGRDPVGLAGEVRKAVLCGKLASILDSSAGEWPFYVSKRLVDLGLQCCESNSRDRPELTPILVRELEQLHSSEERPVPSFFLCPILQEIMHDPQVAADGFTYEGEALRGWLENGRETSPMTNLKLDHLHLTPNHALRLAIQDWLCES